MPHFGGREHRRKSLLWKSVLAFGSRARFGTFPVDCRASRYFCLKHVALQPHEAKHCLYSLPGLILLESIDSSVQCQQSKHNMQIVFEIRFNYRDGYILICHSFEKCGLADCAMAAQEMRHLAKKTRFEQGNEHAHLNQQASSAT
jgi:hypothetical protein